MDGNNWRPAAQPQGQSPAEAPSMDAGDWRTQLQPDSRQRIVNKIMETLKRHLPFSGQDGLHELKKIAIRFEEKIYSAATSQSDYLRKISLKMLTMETKSQSSTMNNPNPPNLQGTIKNTSDPVSQSMQTQVHNQGQPLPVPLANNQSQSLPQLLPQNIQNNIASTGVQSSVGVQSAMPPLSSLTQSPIPNAGGQNSNMQNVSGNSQNSMGNSMGQGVASNMFANSQRQLQGRQLSQQVIPQQQQQSQNSQQQFLYQPQQLLKQKFQQGNISQSHMQSHIQQQQQKQQQQQNLLQPNQLQSSQHSLMQTSTGMQPSIMQSAPHSSLQQSQQSSAQQSTQSVLQQHQQSILRQQQQSQQVASIHHQQAAQQQMLPSQQQQQQQLMEQQQLIGQPQNTANMQQNSLLSQQNNVSDMQPQQQQRLLSQQKNIPNLQQQQLMAQQNNLPGVHTQSNVSGLQQQQQQQQLLVSQSLNSMQSNQHSGHMLQQSKVSGQQQTQQSASTLLPAQGQPSQGQQQLMSQIQSQPAQLQPQLNMQQQSTLLQRDMQQRLQPGLLQTHNVIDQQKHMFQSQRAVPEASSTSLDSTAQTGNANAGDWEEEVYQKIKTMKEMYLPELSEMYHRISAKLQQQESLPQQPKSPQLEKFKTFKAMLEHVISFIQVPRMNITIAHKDKMGSYEKQIISFLNTNNNRPRKLVPPLQQGQLPPPHTQSLQQQQQQAQQAQPQITQLQPHENQMNSQLQPIVSQGSVGPMQPNNASSLQNGVTSFSSVSTAQQNMMNSLQGAQNMDSGQGSALGSLQQVAAGSLQQNPVSASQQANINALTSQSGVSVLQNSHQSNSSMLNLKQQEQHILQAQLKLQFHQRQLIQKQLQQQHLPPSQQARQPTQLQAHQMSQLHQINDANDLKMRQGMSLKQGAFHQHPPTSQRAAYHSQQLKPGATFPISSPQLLQTVSPQIPQHPSPQLDQQTLSSTAKSGSSFQIANSPFVAPSPLTPLSPSPMPGDAEKNNPSVSSLTNTVNIGHQQASVAVTTAQSLAIGTPGISASPLLAEFTSPDGNLGNVSATVSGKSSVTEQPLERLLKAVKSTSPKALNHSVSDISSVVSMIDRIAGSAPGNGSRAAVGEDLVAMTKCRLQARNIASQDGTTGTKKMRRYTSAMPLNVTSSAGSVNDSFKHLASAETSDLESTATSCIKRPRIEANHALLEEIREINQRLIDTVVDISDEDVDPSASAAVEGGEGTIVKCSFNAVALGPNLKSQYASAQMSPIQPLRMLIPVNYPNCSPVLLDKFPVEVSKGHDDLSLKAKLSFSISLRSLSQPMSLWEIARIWDVCARAVLSDYAQQSGGGSFSSKYGTWENCSTVA